ncbi:hypothetical protein Dimus_008014, partial [Dionaea muscipula]
MDGSSQSHFVLRPTTFVSWESTPLAKVKRGASLCLTDEEMDFSSDEDEDRPNEPPPLHGVGNEAPHPYATDAPLYSSRVVIGPST